MEATQEPTSPAPDAGLGPIGLFLIKTVIVSAAIVLSAWILLDVLDGFATRRMQQLEQTLRTATSLGGRQFWTKLEGELDKRPTGGRIFRQRRKRRSSLRSKRSRTGGGRSCRKPPRPSRAMRTSHRSDAAAAFPIPKLAYATAPLKRTSESNGRWQRSQHGLWI